MVTLERPAYYVNERFAEYCGLSTDDKGAIKEPHNGDYFDELDTSKVYRYNAASAEWVEQPKDGVSVDSNIPAMTSETAGHFLSNDGTATHWQEFASADFIITLTDNKDGTYVADKTFVEIKAALEGKENIAVAIGNGHTRLPLMSAEVAESGDAGFTFGYTQLTLDGQLVTTRAVNYFHSADPASDQWTDVDQTAEYLKTTGGVMDGNLSMANNNIIDIQELQINPANPVYIGSVIHTQGTPGVRVTATSNHELAVVAPDSQSEYKPINVADPTALTHAVTLGYLAQEQKDSTATKKTYELQQNSAITVSLNDGIYLFSACDEQHRGLCVVYVCGNSSTVSNIGEMTGWAVSKNSYTNNAIYIDNTLTIPLTVYVTSIGNGGF